MKKQLIFITNDKKQHSTLGEAKSHVIETACGALHKIISKRDNLKTIEYIDKTRFIDTLFGTYDDIVELYEVLSEILGNDYNINNLENEEK